MDEKTLNQIIDEEVKQMEKDFHLQYRTIWSIKKLARRSLERLANKIIVEPVSINSDMCRICGTIPVTGG